MFVHKRPLILVACLSTILLLLLRIAYSSNPNNVWHMQLPTFNKPALRQQLSSRFPYNASNTFPAKIWQTWKYTPSQPEFKSNLRYYEGSWTDLNPGFAHTVANDTVAASLIHRLYAGLPDICDAYDSLPQPVLKADFFRYLILLAEGGIYSDIDTTALQPAKNWLPEETRSCGLVVGIEADLDRDDWADWYTRRIQFCQWTIQSKPGHPILVDIVASITEETLRRKALDELNRTSVQIVMEFTGPAIWTDKIFQYFNDPNYFDRSDTDEVTWHRFANLTEATRVGDVMVLPITSFSPGWGHMGARPVSDPMAFVSHAFAGSWKGNDNVTTKART